MRSQALLHPVTPPRMRTSQWALAIRFLTIGICFLATLPLAAGQVPDTLLHTFPNPAPGASDAIAISGSHLVIGDSASSNGNAYVYDLASSTPTVPAVSLTYANPDERDYFGFSVAIAGPRVAVGCPGNGNGWGTVFLYDLASPAPEVPVITFTNVTMGLHNPGSHNGALGVSVALSDRWLVAGAWQGNIGAAVRGSAHVFDLTGVTPTVPLMILTNPGPALGSVAFGYAVALAGSRVVVGAPYNTAGAGGAGSAYVYDLAGDDPTRPSVVLTNPTPAADENFGLSVAISGNRIVTGARGDDTSGFNAGIAYVYDLGSATPDTPALTLTNPNPASSDHFGSAVAIAGNLVAVGVPRAGIVYVFDLASATPTQSVATLTNQFTGIGGALAMEGALVAVTPGVHLFGPAPTLDLVHSAPHLATLSWSPTTSSGFALQYAETMPPTHWVDAPSGETNPVTIAATNAARFYRLFKP